MQVATFTLNPTVDKSCSVDQVLAERKLRCGPPSYDPGGGGINVARALRNLGGQVKAYWTRGGPIGTLLKQLLDAEKLPHESIEISQMTRENLIVFEEASQQQYRFGMPGPELNSEDVQRCLERLKSLSPVPQYLVLSGSLPPGAPDDFYFRAARQIPKGCRVVLDTSGAALRHGLGEGVELIKPNLRELGQLVENSVETDQQIQEAARQLIQQQKVRIVVTSLGSGGAILVTADHCQHIRAPTVKIRSKVGAGDSTVAGIVLGLIQNRPIPEAVRLGVAAGSAAVMTEGTQLCRSEDVWRLFEQTL